MKKIAGLLILTMAFTAVTAIAQQTKVVVIPLNGQFKINSADCPASSGSSIAGPVGMYNFCWYLSQDGITCDQVCADLSGANMAYGAEGAWEDNCDGADTDDVATWFFNNGNPGNWVDNLGSTGYHTLGYGYDGSTYYGKCASGTSNDNGAYPTDPNGDGTRNVVCPCFGLMKP